VLVTVITPTMGRPDLLQDAKDSVAAQAATGLQVEHIVIDGVDPGAAADHEADGFPLRHLYSAPRGVFDAYNVGIEHARGDILGFLNDDDLLPAGTIDAVARLFRLFREADMVSGAAEVVHLGGSSLREPVRMIDHPRILDADPIALLSWAPMLNARWFRRQFLERIGPFDASFRFAGDREFMLRPFQRGAVNVVTNQLFYTYRIHPGSLTFRDRRSTERILEEIRLLGMFAATCTDVALRGLARQVSGRREWELLARSLRSGSMMRALRSFPRNPSWPILAARHRVQEGVRLLFGRDPIDGSQRISGKGQWDSSGGTRCVRW
jgi:glycosyltransferase involved in cell wall biosynthesis